MHHAPKTVPMLSPTLIAAGLILAGCGGMQGPPAAAGPTAAAASAASTSRSPCRGPLPSPTLEVPAGNELDFHLEAVGVQIYTCTATATGPAWVFKAPEANLFSGTGEPAGTHYAGPTWEALDGSKVVGARVSGFTPDPASIPWLLLRAASHAGEGRMDEVTFVQRLRTSGGVAPVDGCDATAAGAGAVARVPYTATYCFYEAK
jgi:hypothetical protein